MLIACLSLADYLTHFCDAAKGKDLQLESSGFCSAALIFGAKSSTDRVLKANAVCKLTIKPPKDEHLAIHVQKLFADEMLAEFSVSTGKYQLFTNHLTNQTRIITEFETDGNLVVNLRAIKDMDLKNLEIELLITSFVKKSATQECPTFFYHDCQNHRCIREFYRCDGQNNCGNNSDEKRCHELGVGALLLISLALIVMVIAFTFRLFSKLMGEVPKRALIRGDSQLSLISNQSNRKDDTRSPLMRCEVVYF